MVLHPLFPDDEDDPRETKGDESFVLQNRKGRTLQPLSKDLQVPPHARPAPTGGGTVIENPAVELIRRKLEALYSEEPNAQEELAEATPPQPPVQRSKHQQFMYELSTSGKSLAQIQTEWHRYYVHLPDNEKHEVWREFYANNARQASAYTNFVQERMPSIQPQHAHTPIEPGFATVSSPISPPAKPRPVVGEHTKSVTELPGVRRKKVISHIKRKVLGRVLAQASAQEKAKQHLQSLVFGLSTGLLVLSVLLFGFFNEMVIAPFIQPSRQVSATPIIVNSDSVAPSDTPEIIIPKINVQIPVVYDESSIKESDVQRALERGVLHYATTVNPGQLGNVAIFGHSSNNIFNKGQYKFAFVLLHKLVPGDIFYLTYGKTVYTYRVYERKVVAPTEVSVLYNVAGKPATAALITCDPPGTSTNRLIVWGEQISPDPSTATTAGIPPTNSTDTPTELPSEGPTLWNRFWSWLF